MSVATELPSRTGGAVGGFQRIILIGYMGAGKTTVGRHLAKRLGLQFYDLDWYIETRHHTTVTQLFAERGEDTFRRIEQAMLHEVAEFEDVVISCGGGTPCFFDNMDYMNSQGQVVYLKASPQVLVRHLQMGHGRRPLLAGMSPDELLSHVTRQLGQREHFYAKARYTLSVDLLDNFDRIRNTIEQLLLLLNHPESSTETQITP